MTFMSAELC